ECHLVHGAVAGDAGVVHQDVDRPEVGDDLRHARGALVEVGNVELVSCDAGRLVELPGGLVVACVGGGDAMTGILEGHGNGFADAPGAAGDDGDALAVAHELAPLAVSR